MLDEDLFDGASYAAEEFFEHVKTYFNNPALFYKCFNTLPEVIIQEAAFKNKNGYRLYSFPSPVKTSWPENNTVFYRMFASSPTADTIIIFVPGWARANLEAEEGLCRQFLKKGIDTCLITKPFHQERKAAHTFSGELFISANIFFNHHEFQTAGGGIKIVDSCV
jgi:hypothetical protein